MAQAGVPVPAGRAHLPVFTAIYADIGDAQSIEQNLSTFSAHVVNVDRIGALRRMLLRWCCWMSWGSATDPEEGAALAVAVAEHFLGAAGVVHHHDAPYVTEGVWPPSMMVC